MCDILWRLGIRRLRRCQGSFQERTGCLEKGLPCLPITPLPTQQKSLCRHTKCPTAKPKQVKQTKPKYCSYPFLYRYLLAAAPNQSSITTSCGPPRLPPSWLTSGSTSILLLPGSDQMQTLMRTWIIPMDQNRHGEEGLE